MKALLMYPDRDLAPQSLLPFESELTQDLELNTLFNAMAAGDELIFKTARMVILFGNGDLGTIRYRQAILQDCLKNPAVIREIYQIPIESGPNKYRHRLNISGERPRSILFSALDMMKMFMGLLKRLRQTADENADRFESEGLTRFFSMIRKELNDDFFSIVENHLKQLEFRNGVLISAGLGAGNKGRGYLLRKPRANESGWIKQLFVKKSPVYSFRLHPYDIGGARTLSILTNKGVNHVANAIAQSAQHIDDFLNMLANELSFYVGCLNLYEQLSRMGEPVTFPIPVPADERKLSSTGLYDVCLALTMKQKVVGNDVKADGMDLVVITGANQGGKSTFMRSIGLAQLMMQCGMFVPAESFCANVCTSIFTHYKRDEDTSMTSGKLDEELSRMSAIADKLTPNSMVLFNESFAATNEREGSEIARQIVCALLKKRIRIFFVTHLYKFARSLYDERLDNAIFLRAVRQDDGTRTFRLIEGEPLETSFGEDLYRRIFAEEPF